MNGLIMALYISMIVSLDCPHDFAVSDFSILRRAWALMWICFVCWSNIKCVSNVTPSILGVLFRGRRELLMKICGK